MQLCPSALRSGCGLQAQARRAGHVQKPILKLGLLSCKGRNGARQPVRRLATTQERTEVGTVAADKRTPSFTLERAVGPRGGEDKELWDTGVFQAQVFPDLPAAATWRALGHVLLQGRIASGSALGTGGVAPQHPDAKDDPRLLVRTVGVQCRSKKELRDHILQQTFRNEEDEGCPSGSADALLCVSGSHPVRQLSIMGSLLPSSLDTLAIAGEMRAKGSLPSSLSLWAVENPLLERDASRLLRKIDAGAEVVVTQPPLNWEAFDRWAEDADRIGALGRCHLVVGLPVLSSAGNLAFWLQLCGAQGAKWAPDEVERWRTAEAQGKEAFQEWRLREHTEMLRRISELPGSPGIHVMPLTKRSRQDTLQLIGAGALKPVGA